MRTVLRPLVLVMSLAVLVVACGTPTTPTATTTATTTTTTTATTPSYTSVTETYKGALVAGGANLYTFHTMPGVLTVTLVSLDPATFSSPIGLSVGMWDGTTCTVVIDSTAATAGTPEVGTASVESDVCVKVSDPSVLPADFTLNYVVTAVHNVK
jgi:hypothetical protein